MSKLALTLAALTSSVAIASSPTVAAPASPIDRALADSSRTDQQADDARRKAANVLALSGVKRGDTVVDFVPGSGYWTRIFTRIVGAKGHVYAIWPASMGKYAAKALPALQARKLANVTAEVQPTDLPILPKPVDLFWTVRNYHDVANGGGEPALNAFNAAVFKALKPGGAYVVIDHADTVGTGLTGTSTRHRIEKSVVIREVEAAGFRFAGESDVLGNPQDDHQATVFDPAIKGHTDQFVLKFRKPS